MSHKLEEGERLTDRFRESRWCSAGLSPPTRKVSSRHGHQVSGVDGEIGVGRTSLRRLGRSEGEEVGGRRGHPCRGAVLQPERIALLEFSDGEWQEGRERRVGQWMGQWAGGRGRISVKRPRIGRSHFRHHHQQQQQQASSEQFAFTGPLVMIEGHAEEGSATNREAGQKRE
eukprot:2631006-Rhodomonas_salina.2